MAGTLAEQRLGFFCNVIIIEVYMRKIIVILACLLAAGPAFAGKDHGKHNGKALPPGLQKKVERGDGLPPGWQKKLTRGSIMGDEYYSRSVVIPRTSPEYVPYKTPGTELLKIQDNIYRIKRDTREIVDIVTGKGGH